MMIPLPVRYGLRQLWGYATFKYGLIAAICGWATYIQFTYRVPSSFIFLLLPWIGVVLGVLNFILLANHFLTQLPKDHSLKETFRQLEWWANLFVRIYVYYSLFLYANAKLDRSLTIEHHSVALSISKSQSDLLGRFPISWINLKSWDDPKRTHRLLLTRYESDNLWGGQALVVNQHSGYFGVRWVSSIEQDEEYYSKEVLKKLPTASFAWKKLINFFLAHQHWQRGIEATNSYLQYYPEDYLLAGSVGQTLAMSGHYDEGIPFLEHAVNKHPTYAGYQILGWAVSWQGNPRKAAEILEGSISLAPDDWEGYYHLGYVYSDLGKPREAVNMFQEVLKRQPHFPEVQAQIADLRKQSRFLK